MLDRLQAVAMRTHLLRFVAIGTGLTCLIVVTFVIFSPPSPEGDRYLIPAIIGLFWSVSAYNFFVIFRSAPDRTDKSEKLWKRVKTRTWRVWYWLMVLIFFGTTLAVVSVSFKLLSVWVQDYGG